MTLDGVLSASFLMSRRATILALFFLVGETESSLFGKEGLLEIIKNV